jgi:hypothetical protein
MASFLNADRHSVAGRRRLLPVFQSFSVSAAAKLFITK